jgi:hypothetical protein
VNDGDTFNDPVLGAVTWNAEGRAWQFECALPDGHTVRGSITPEDSQRPLADQGLVEMQRCVGWIRNNEPSIRAHIADEMFEGWRDDLVRRRNR